MNKHRKSYLSLCTLAALSSFTLPLQALAMQQDRSEDDEEAMEKITVVGSNIRGAQAAGRLPVTILDSDDIINTGAVTGDELLRSIPQVGDISFNNERSIGGVNDARGDVASINLRGIGTGNTLTLLNGRRLVLHPGTQTENFVPVTTVNSNTLPVTGLRRLEVLRDGASALYGTDAVAGVVNYVLKKEVTQTQLNLSAGNAEGTSMQQYLASGSTGVFFNDNKSHLSLSFAYYTRDEIGANERSYSASEDRRFNDRIPEAFVGDTQLDNRSLSSPWAIYDGENIGRFHIRPESMGDCFQTLSDGVCAAEGSIPRDMRYDSAQDQSMTSAIDRVNLFAYYTHSLAPNLELFGEALYYEALSKRRREQNANLTAQRFTISENAAYNPFGETVTLRNIRPMDVGPRRIEVEDSSYRLLGGIKGYSKQWEWESALLYSRADTLDTGYNRIRVSALQQAINSTNIEEAYNPFIGGNPENVNNGTSVYNSAAVIAGLTEDITRDSTSELAQWDFKLSNPALANWYAGDIGIAAGVEYRYEAYADDRHYLLDGSTPFYDQVTGELMTNSDVLGSSFTPDSEGSRNVFSAYTELLVPLHQTIDMQLALRYERFSDVGSVTKPKVALSWLPVDWLQLRASYSGGFRAPNLPQVVEESVSRTNSRTDPVIDDRYSITEIRGGNSKLTPEDDEIYNVGFAITPFENFLITVDRWTIEQENVVGILNSQTHLLYDSLLRSQGSSNPAVIRNDALEVVYVNNQYDNLEVREISGTDISINYEVNSEAFGLFNFSINAAHLRKFMQTPDPISAIVLEAQENGNPAVPIDIPVVGAGDLRQMDGNPKWRSFARLDWDLGNWGAGIRVNYVDDFYETSVTTSDGDMMPIDSWITTDIYLDYYFSQESLDGLSLRIGARNLADKKPPIADESFGYFSDVHSNRGRYTYATLSWAF
ncbi:MULTISPECIES: TonB-dependent receptor domain-containing protein [unclassified Idiomarina]|jgi:outer membrane receptor protein involved in Fe transport|uniref:TonB-dependent receptor domain-containing protein n=1 Tax=unclassified Idiomarina TaxID=2614829 RepID=UPI00257FD61A|nr:MULTISPECIES: TonB-dependent receptor [unclassified Idiomarina]|tara:strand:- start:36351 stop:39167 length:2817 start_codon:yes stop_codon:yes gene_type:complete